MSLPTEIEMIIISFTPEFHLGLVCKTWRKKIRTIRKNASDAIGKWYHHRKVPENIGTVQELVRYMVVHYPTEYFLSYPEFAVKKLGLNEDILTTIPLVEYRKKSDVKSWILGMPISLNEWLFVGI